MRIACTSTETFDIIKKKFPNDDIIEIKFRYDYDQYHLLQFTWDTSDHFDMLILDIEKFKKSEYIFSTILLSSKKICKNVFLIDDGLIENNYKDILIGHDFKNVQQLEELVSGICY